MCGPSGTLTFISKSQVIGRDLKRKNLAQIFSKITHNREVYLNFSNFWRKKLNSSAYCLKNCCLINYRFWILLGKYRFWALLFY